MKLRKVIVSTSNCIYKNLVFEKLLFLNLPDKCNILFFYRNTPSVVIGRYQNTWLEVNMKKCRESQVKIARRESGGGTVYHDIGNLNVSFITAKDDYDRKINLNLTCDSLNLLKLKFPQVNQVVIGPRDTIVLKTDGAKISGSAARIAFNKAYHHFTLLLNSNLNEISQCLKSDLKNPNFYANTNASPSIISKIANFSTNLNRRQTEVLFYNVIQNIAKTFRVDNVEYCSIEEYFPNIWKIHYDEFASWNHVFAKSSTLTFKRSNFDNVNPQFLEFLKTRVNVKEPIVKIKDGKVFCDSFPFFNGCSYKPDAILRKINEINLDLDSALIFKLFINV
ncbi:hypothetical protein A3Q56_06336 [Intoshia linei]|uniref:BPL/LPL catalytic domain-containing protein n=1 Tax=Intoshia linei TaxID=1819745 RepID=A0A177AVA7_9BILA|nr:hypothetical protein A3Q56_06336 [Intoshia linei]